MDKLQLYYQPSKNNPDDIKSLSISYYDSNPEDNTYKQKIVLEKNGEKYKIKRCVNKLNEIVPFIDQLSLFNYKDGNVDFEQSYYHVKFGDGVYITNNAEDIRDLLNFMNFDEVMRYDANMYQRCD